MEMLNEIAPWFNVSGRQISASGAIGELIKGIQNYKARSDTALLDGIFTALEIKVLLRTSIQDQEPQYRAGWVTYLNASKSWLWDPNARSQFKHQDLARLDNAWKEAVRLHNEKLGIELTDLEAEGQKGEYETLVEPTKA